MKENTNITELYTSQNSTEANNSLSSGEMHLNVDRGDIERIEDTVFGIANNKDGWFLIMGNHALTKPVQTRKECLENLGDITSKQWDIIFKMIIIVTDHVLLNEKPVVK